MLNKVLLISLLFLSHLSLSIDREDIIHKLLETGRHDLVIKWLEPQIEKGNYEPLDYSFLIAAYILKNDHFNALAHTNKWLNISLKKKDNSSIIYASGYKMDILRGIEDMEGCIAAAEFGLSQLRVSDSIEKAVFNIRLGLYHYETGNFDLANDIYSKIKFKNVIAARLESMYFNNFGLIYRGLGLADSAIYCLQRALNYNTTFESDEYKALNYSNLALTCADLDKYELAFKYLDTAATMTSDHNHVAFQSIYENYFKIYDNLGMADSALVYVYKIKALNESLFHERMDLETKELKAQYEKEIQLKTKIIQSNQKLEKSQLQLSLLIVIILLTATIAGGLILFLRNKNLKASRNNLLTTQQLLRTQITPHFLYNSLSNIQGMILKQENTLASNYLSKFSRLVRLVLKNSQNKVVSISDELEAIKYYLDLQSARFEERLTYSIVLDEKVKESDLVIPPMLIQPFVENCIEHGFKNIDRKGEINIHIYFKNQSLTCKVTDNGVGVEAVPSKSVMPKKESLSTGITVERMRLIAKEFKSKANLEIMDRKKYGEQGTIVTLEIPYKYD